MWYQWLYDELLPYFFLVYIQCAIEKEGRQVYVVICGQVLAKNAKLLVITDHLVYWSFLA